MRLHGQSDLVVVDGLDHQDESVAADWPCGLASGVRIGYCRRGHPNECGSPMADDSVVSDDEPNTPRHAAPDGPTNHMEPPLLPVADDGGPGPAAALPCILGAPQLPGELGRLGGYRVLSLIGR